MESGAEAAGLDAVDGLRQAPPGQRDPEVLDLLVVDAVASERQREPQRPGRRSLTMTGTQMKIISERDLRTTPVRSRKSGSWLTCGTTTGFPLWTTRPKCAAAGLGWILQKRI